MNSGGKGIELYDYEPNSNWDIISTSWKEELTSVEASISFELKIKRKPLYVILAVLLPISMLAILNICVFVLPSDSGEKASYAITVFLAFAVFLTIISSTLPENSESIAIFSVFLIVQTISSTLITITALVMIRLNSKPDSDPVPHILSKILLIISCHCCCKRCCKSSKVAVTDSTPKLNPETASLREDNCHKMTWKRAVGILDKMFFVIFLLVFIVSAVVSFTAAAVM